LKRLNDLVKRNILKSHSSIAYPSPTLLEIHANLVLAVKTLKLVSKRGLHRSKTWTNQKVNELHRRITDLEQARLKLRRDANSSNTQGIVKNLIRKECELTSTTFNGTTSKSMRLSAATAATVLQKQAASKVWRMQTASEEKIDSTLDNIAKRNWNSTKPRIRTALISRLNIDNNPTSDPKAILDYVAKEFENRYTVDNHLSANCPNFPRKILRLIESTSQVWDQKVIDEFLSDILAWDVKVAAKEGADTAGLDEIMADLIRNLDNDVLK
jgi:hypothetical protein